MGYTEKEMRVLDDTLQELKKMNIPMTKSELSILIDDGICAKERMFSDYLIASHLYQYFLREDNPKLVAKLIKEAKELDDELFLKWVKK